jgi:hypothetical protein
MIGIRLRFQPVVALMAALVVALSASACGGTDNLTAVPLSSGGGDHRGTVANRTGDPHHP